MAKKADPRNFDRWTRGMERYGAAMQTWKAERMTILLAIRTICRYAGRILLCISVPAWLLKWRWWSRNGDRVDSLREELHQLEDRRPMHPEARDPVETRLLGGPVYPRWDGTTERLPRPDDGSRMIDPHYSRTICRYVDELARKNALMLHGGATPKLMREVGVLSITIKNLADAALADNVEAA